VEDHQLKRKKRERQATQLKARDGYSLVAGGRGRSRFLCGMLHPIHLLLERLVLIREQGISTENRLILTSSFIVRIQ